MCVKAVLHYLILLVVTVAAHAQINLDGNCPDFYTSILFTPEVMLDLVKRGESFLVMTGGSTDDSTFGCQALSFHREQTYSYSYRDSSGAKQILAGTYTVNFPSFTKTSSITLQGLRANMLGADATGSATLVPVAYGFGIGVYVACQNSYWSATHEQQYFMFFDRSIDISKANYFDMLQMLGEANIIPDTLQGSLKIAFPNQSCATCRRAAGQCIVKPHTAFIKNFMNATRFRTGDDVGQIIL